MKIFFPKTAIFDEKTTVFEHFLSEHHFVIKISNKNKFKHNLQLGY